MTYVAYISLVLVALAQLAVIVFMLIRGEKERAVLADRIQAPDVARIAALNNAIPRFEVPVSDDDGPFVPETYEDDLALLGGI